MEVLEIEFEPERWKLRLENRRSMVGISIVSAETLIAILETLTQKKYVTPFFCAAHESLRGDC
jgi:hypothetical protein